MAERGTVNQSTQIGVEVTPGTAVATTKILRAIELSGGIKAENEVWRPLGSKYAAFVVPGKEWTEWKIGGRATYGEEVYLLSSILKTVTAGADGATAKLWTFAPALSAEDTVKTFTIEMGSSVRAHSFAYGLVTELGYKFSRTGVERSGTLLGQRLSDGITMTTGNTPVETTPVPVAGTQISVYVADSWAGLAGASASTRVLEAEWKIASRFNPLWVLDASKSSWVAHVETAPKVTLNLSVEADAAGMAFLTLMRNATTKWARIKASGADIDSGKPYLFQIDGAYNVSEPQEFSDQDGVYKIGWNLTAVYDSTAAKTYEVQVRNKLAAL